MNLEYIYNEELQGVIDGVNKEFTTLYDISKIEEVIYLGAAYRGVSFTGNVVTFVDAPLSGSDRPTIDYFRVVTTALNEDGDVTFGEIIDDVYSKIGQLRVNGITPNKVYKETQIKQHINNGFKRIKNLRLYKDVVSQYSFNKMKDTSCIGYNSSYVKIGEGLSYVPSSGIFILGNDVVVNYSNYITGNLVGTPGVVYESGSRVSVGYKIPSGVKKIVELTIEGREIPYIDFREYSIGKYGFTVYRTSNGDEYIVLPYSDSCVVTVKYQPTYNTYVNDADIVGIEREYYEVLSYYALTQIFKYREDDRWQIAERDYTQLLKEYKSYKSRAVDGINNTLRSNILTNF